MNPPKGKRLGRGGHYRREIRAAHCCRQAPDQAVTSTIIPHPTDPVVIPSTPTAILPGLMPVKPDRSGPRPALLPCFIRTCPAPIPSGLHDSDWSSPNPPIPTLFQSDRTCRIRLFRTVRILSVLPYPVLSCPGPFTRGFFPCAAPGAVWCGRTPAGKASGPGDTRRFRLNARNDGYAGRRTAADPPFSARPTTVLPRSARCAGGRPHTV